MKKRLAVALSGGVDSLVAAFLLKREYPDLFGIHFTNGYEPSSQDYQDINRQNINTIAEQLGVPVYCVDLKDEFEKDVVSYFIETYQKGKTPNPCIICNKTVKFGALYQAAKNLGADFLATGHYARLEHRSSFSLNRDRALNRDFSSSNIDCGDTLTVLLKGTDNLKEQSYFLAMLSPEQLQHAVFPLGDLTKQEVLSIAVKNNLVPIHKKESQDICFIRENSFADFIASKCTPSIKSEKQTLIKSPFAEGDIVTTDNKIVGRHKGLYCYTVGQRRGLNCPGPAPYYVKKIDMENNRLVIGFKEEMFAKECNIININWLSDKAAADILKSPLRAVTKIRYSHSGAASTLSFEHTNKEEHTDKKYDQDQEEGSINQYFNNSNRLKVIFDEPQLAVTPGQCAVFYDGDQVLGAGFIA
ncbi:MAG: tRNA 2-thiouridine(34) synthase MnmA [Desulfamplus sp.]